MVTEMRISREQKEMYESTMQNMNPCGRRGNGKYTACISVKLLKVDPAYQRIETRTRKKLRKLAANWNENKLTPIIVVPHPEEYCFYVIDGYGRLLVSTTMLQASYKALDAIILTNVPANPADRRRFEAELFIGQGTEVERITPVQMHSANLLIGDEAAISLQRVLDKYHVQYVATTGQRKAATLGSYKGAYDIARRNGYSCLEFIFSVIENAGWRYEANGYSRNIMDALKDVWCAYPSKKQRQEMHDFFCKELKQCTPKIIKEKATGRYAWRSDETRIGMYLVDMLVEQLEYERTQYFEPLEADKAVRRVV